MIHDYRRWCLNAPCGHCGDYNHGRTDAPCCPVCWGVKTLGLSRDDKAAFRADMIREARRLHQVESDQRGPFWGVCPSV